MRWSFGICLPAMLALSILSCGTQRSERLTKEGDRVILQIERFHAEKGRLPSSLDELSVPYDPELFYDLRKSDEFVLWFGTGLGESEFYDSRERGWKTGY